MKIYDYLESLPIDFTCKRYILNHILGIEGNRTVGAYLRFSKNNEVPDGFEINENVLDLMQTVNCMVKDASCPNNLRNRFYGYKTSIMRNLIREGNVSNVYDEGNCYCFTVDAKYVFHQLKDCCKDLTFDVVGTREYQNTDDPIPFDLNTFKQFQISASYYLGKYRFSHVGHSQDPIDFRKHLKIS